MIAAILAANALAQAHPRDAKWGEMFKREAAIIKPLKDSLPGYAYQYCLTEMTAVHENVPKTGSVPFGIIQWDDLSDDAFNLDLSILEGWQTGFMIKCLSEYKASLNSAEDHR